MFKLVEQFFLNFEEKLYTIPYVSIIQSLRSISSNSTVDSDATFTLYDSPKLYKRGPFPTNISRHFI